MTIESLAKVAAALVLLGTFGGFCYALGWENGAKDRQVRPRTRRCWHDTGRLRASEAS